MSYSYAAAEQAAAPSYSRVAAAALLAVSAGACVGVAVSPAITSFYAPTAVRAVTSQVAVSTPITQVQAVSAPAYVQEYAASPVAEMETSSVSGWTLLSGGLFASAAALMAFALKGSRAESSEQIAMLATFGKKTAGKTVGKTAAKKAPVNADRKLWYPTAVSPEWLDGSLPGDRGFDPWGLAKPTEYLQFDLDGLDQNAPKNNIGKVVGVVKADPDQVSTDALQPYSEVFGLQRFRECELLHGRWAMLAVVGCIVGEAVTGVAWQDAGLVEATQGSTYWGNPLPFTGTQVVWFEVLSMGFVEIFRNTELNTEKRCYPGGAFDPLGLTSKDEETTFRLKEAELKHGRLAMVAFLGFAAAAANTGAGATEAFSKWALSFS